MKYLGVDKRNMLVHNELMLGKELQDWLNSDAMMDLLSVHQINSWCNGGCLSLATAIVMWLGADRAEIHTLCERPKRHSCTSNEICIGLAQEHAMAFIPGVDVYIDGDGIGTAADMLTKFKKLEGAAGIKYVIEPALHLEGGVLYFDPGLAVHMARQLAEKFRPGQFMSRLSKEMLRSRA